MWLGVCAPAIFAVPGAHLSSSPFSCSFRFFIASLLLISLIPHESRLTSINNATSRSTINSPSSTILCKPSIPHRTDLRVLGSTALCPSIYIVFTSPKPYSIPHHEILRSHRRRYRRHCVSRPRRGRTPYYYHFDHLCRPQWSLLRWSRL